LDAAEVALELLLLVPEAQHLLLGQEVERAPALHLTELAEANQPARDRLEVRQHAPEPPRIDERHADPRGVLLNRLLRLLLRADEQHGSASTPDLEGESVGLVEPGEGLLEVDDVDAGSLPVQEAAHLRVPAPCLVSEVD